MNACTFALHLLDVEAEEKGVGEDFVERLMIVDRSEPPSTVDHGTETHVHLPVVAHCVAIRLTQDEKVDDVRNIVVPLNEVTTKN